MFVRNVQCLKSGVAAGFDDAWPEKFTNWVVRMSSSGIPEPFNGKRWKLKTLGTEEGPSYCPHLQGVD